IALVAPRVILVAGNTPCAVLLGGAGILRQRGHWATAQAAGIGNIPVMPMAHPAYLLRNPAAKREAWADLLLVQARLRAP
ncbi:MAG: uracil-DNA glycosylase family protein, partial [Paracoccaceae bacterium]|nr:uracil-DNA glycosylase family protein [Paracoccaceae bacterium]